MDEARLRRLRASYKRLLISLSDFHEAADALNTIALMKRGHVRIESVGDGIEDKLRWALLTQAVIAYCRPFLDSDGEAAIPKLSPSMLGMKLDDAAKRVHRNVMGLRCKVIAHSDYELRPASAQGRSVGFDVPTFFYLDSIDRRRFWALAAHAVTMAGIRIATMDRRYGAKMHDPRPPPGLKLPRP